MTTYVEDVMTIDVVAVGEQTPFKEIVEIMRRSRVSSVPVLDAARQVRGVVSKSDLFSRRPTPPRLRTFI